MSAPKHNYPGKRKKGKNRRKYCHPSHTPGRIKGEHCQASPLDKYMAKRNRSYKHEDYSKWCEKSRKRVYGKQGK